MPNFAFSMLGLETATLVSGASLSNAVSLGGLRLFALSMPAVWTTASITFQASFDNGVTWQNLYDSNGNEISVSAASARHITLDPLTFAAIPMIKVRSGTAASPVAQSQDSAVSLILRSV